MFYSLDVAIILKHTPSKDKGLNHNTLQKREKESGSKRDTMSNGVAVTSGGRAATGIRTASSFAEASVLEVLQAEIGRNFEAEVCERLGHDIGYRFVTRFPVGPPPFG